MAMLLGWESAHGRGQSLGMAEAVFGDHRLVAEQLQRLRELTPDDLLHAAADVLTPERRSVVWLVPGKGAPAGAGAKGAAR
jgi:predicted Zn-dependent peptidase